MPIPKLAAIQGKQKQRNASKDQHQLWLFQTASCVGLAKQVADITFPVVHEDFLVVDPLNSNQMKENGHEHCWVRTL
jgi:hypothetical protein